MEIINIIYRALLLSIMFYVLLLVPIAIFFWAPEYKEWVYKYLFNKNKSVANKLKSLLLHILVPFIVIVILDKVFKIAIIEKIWYK